MNEVSGGRREYTESDRKLMAFLAVDIAGSTEFKTRNADIMDYERHWARSVEKFFDNVNGKFLGSMRRESAASHPFKSLDIWKILGDEIIYQWEINRNGDGRENLLSLCRQFLLVVKEIDETMYKENGLRLKAVAWVAGFPIRNTEVNIHERRDFIGPDIDLGFRLGAVTRPGRMTVSMDLAQLLAEATPPRNETAPLDIHHVGWQRLKGINGGHPYPVYWVEIGAPGRFVPWEGFECGFTKEFMGERSGERSKDQLRVEIKKIRESLPPDLHLCEPYISLDDMPEEHKIVWKKWEEQKEKYDSYETGGEGMGEEEE